MGLAKDYVPGNGAVYDADSGFARSLRDVARMIKNGVGLQVACIDYGNWDMHTDLGPVRPAGDTTGDYWFADHLLEFTSALAAFMQDLGSKMDDVTVVTLTEFGRRAEDNTSEGSGPRVRRPPSCSRATGSRAVRSRCRVPGRPWPTVRSSTATWT